MQMQQNDKIWPIANGYLLIANFQVGTTMIQVGTKPIQGGTNRLRVGTNRLQVGTKWAQVVTNNRLETPTVSRNSNVFNQINSFSAAQNIASASKSRSFRRLQSTGINPNSSLRPPALLSDLCGEGFWL
jgi:hypothetical protein